MGEKQRPLSCLPISHSEQKLRLCLSKFLWNAWIIVTDNIYWAFTRFPAPCISTSHALSQFYIMDSIIFLLFQKKKLKQEMIRQYARSHVVSMPLNQSLKPVVSLLANHCPRHLFPACSTAPVLSTSWLLLIVQVSAKDNSWGRLPLTTLFQVLPPCHSLSQHPPLHPITTCNYLLRCSLAALPTRIQAPWIASIIHILYPQGLAQCLLSKVGMSRGALQNITPDPEKVLMPHVWGWSRRERKEQYAFMHLVTVLWAPSSWAYLEHVPYMTCKFEGCLGR